MVFTDSTPWSSPEKIQHGFSYGQIVTMSMNRKWPDYDPSNLLTPSLASRIFWHSHISAIVGGSIFRTHCLSYSHKVARLSENSVLSNYTHLHLNIFDHCWTFPADKRLIDHWCSPIVIPDAIVNVESPHRPPSLVFRYNVITSNRC